MNVLELFAGSRSFSKVAEEMGCNTYCTDIEPFEGIDQVCDIFDFDIKKIPFQTEVCWASIPCTTFSVASIGHHWTGGHRAYIPKTKEAEIGLKIVQKTIDIITEINPKYYYIENPRGLLRKLPVIRYAPIRRTVWYCQYGDNRAKPTDIFTNDMSWIPRNKCFNGNTNCHHEPAPRGSKTGTQGLANNYERSKVPYELCREIIESLLCTAG